mgnify:CR=1 FL=1
MTLRASMVRYLRSDQGTTAIEYGLVLTFIALAVLTTIQLLGATVLTELYEQIVAAWGA